MNSVAFEFYINGMFSKRVLEWIGIRADENRNELGWEWIMKIKINCLIEQ